MPKSLSLEDRPESLSFGLFSAPNCGRPFSATTAFQELPIRYSIPLAHFIGLPEFRSHPRRHTSAVASAASPYPPHRHFFFIGREGVSLRDPWSLGRAFPDVAAPIEVVEHSVLHGFDRWIPAWFGPCKRREARVRPRVFGSWILPRFSWRVLLSFDARISSNIG